MSHLNDDDIGSRASATVTSTSDMSNCKDDVPLKEKLIGAEVIEGVPLTIDTGRQQCVAWKMRFLTGTASLGGFLFGYDAVVIATAMLPLARTYELNEVEQEMIVSAGVLGAFVASFVGGTLISKLGRRKAILIAAVTFILGTVMQAVSWDYTSLVAARIIVGAGIGVASLTTPVYIAEVAKPSMRGQLVTVNSFMIAVGQFLGGVVDGVIDKFFPVTGWRIMLGLTAVPAICMWIGFLGLPETPRWLASKNRREEALQVLKSYRDSDEEAMAELEDMLGASPQRGSQEGAKSDSDIVAQPAPKEEKGFITRFCGMFADPPTRRALMFGCGLMLLQELSGIDIIMYYTATIYEEAEFSEEASIWLSAVTAVAHVVGIGISVFLVERAGRRVLVLASLFLVTVSLLGLGGSFFLSWVKSDPVMFSLDSCVSQPALIWSGKTLYCHDCTVMEGCGYCDGVCVAGDELGPFNPKQCPTQSDWVFSSCKNEYGFLTVAFIVVYLLAFGIGMGGLPWTINSEIYPQKYRSSAVSFSTATNWICNLISSSTFLSLKDPSVLISYGTFWLYGTVSLLGLVWLCFVMPETKGLSLEEIEDLFRQQTDNPRSGDGGDSDKEALVIEEEYKAEKFVDHASI